MELESRQESEITGTDNRQLGRHHMITVAIDCQFQIDKAAGLKAQDSPLASAIFLFTQWSAPTSQLCLCFHYHPYRLTALTCLDHQP